MREELLKKIGNPTVRKKLGSLLNNGLSLDEGHIRELVSREIESSYLQVFPTVGEREILKNMNIEMSKAENLFLIVEGNPNLHWKATELVSTVTERSDAKVVWNFSPSNNRDRILKIIALSY